MKAAIYSRFSSDNQRSESIDAQVRAVSEYAEKNKYTIVHIYKDEARTGTNDERPEFQRMIADAKKGLFEVLLVHKFDRFARNKYDSVFYKRTLKNYGIKIISVTEQLDDSPEAVILESVLEGMAEYYSKNLAREVRKGQNENALKGLHNGGIPPLGYDVNSEKRYVINTIEADSVRKIFEWYLLGDSYFKIATKLNELGRKSKTGKPFRKSSIRDILFNEKYIGNYTFGKRADSKKNNWKYNKEYVVIENNHPAIINKEVFKEVQKRMKSKERGPRANPKGDMIYMLTGLMKCGLCGGAYVGNKKSRAGRKKIPYYVYICNHRKATRECNNPEISKDKLEAFVINDLKKRLFSKDGINEIAKRIEEKQKQEVNLDDKKYYESEIKKLKAQQNKLLDLYLADAMSQEVLENKSNEIKDKLNVYEYELNKIESMTNFSYDFDKLKGLLLLYSDLIDDESPENKKRVIHTFVKEIKVYPDTIDIIYKINLNSCKKDDSDNDNTTISSKTTLIADKVGGDGGSRTRVRKHRPLDFLQA